MDPKETIYVIVRGTGTGADGDERDEFPLEWWDDEEEAEERAEELRTDVPAVDEGENWSRVDYEVRAVPSGRAERR